MVLMKVNPADEKVSIWKNRRPLDETWLDRFIAAVSLDPKLEASEATAGEGSTSEEVDTDINRLILKKGVEHLTIFYLKKSV